LLLEKELLVLMFNIREADVELALLITRLSLSRIFPIFPSRICFLHAQHDLCENGCLAVNAHLIWVG
jgi:hypothetical protein